MAILELLFIILKTVVLSTIYIAIVVFILLLSNIIKKQQGITIILKRKIRFWLVLHFMISVGLFAFRFTYWQDTGIGDHNSIPIGFGQNIENEDFENTYFQPSENATAIQIDNYTIYTNKLCAEVNHDVSNSPKFDYILYDLSRKQLKTFKNKEEYEVFAKQQNIPSSSDFYSFEKHFEVYLKQRPFWRKWLVP